MINLSGFVYNLNAILRLNEHDSVDEDVKLYSSNDSLIFQGKDPIFVTHVERCPKLKDFIITLVVITDDETNFNAQLFSCVFAKSICYKLIAAVVFYFERIRFEERYRNKPEEKVSKMDEWITKATEKLLLMEQHEATESDVYNYITGAYNLINYWFP